MKTFRVFAAVLAAAAALALTGCNKMNFYGGGQTVRFVADANAPETKAVYGEDAGGYQRIPWQNNDQIVIASAQAATQSGRHAWTYTVTNIDDQKGSATKVSHGTLSNKAAEGKKGSEYDTGLLWDEEINSYTFFGMYPASKAGTLNPATGAFTANIPASTGTQATAKTVGLKDNTVATLDPTADEYLMVAKKSTAYTSGVIMQFYPAFTAFQVTLYSDVDNMTVNSCSLRSESRALAGNFSATIADTGVTSFSTDSNIKEASVSLEYKLDKGKGVTFNIFTLPQEYEDLTFLCTFTLNGETKTRKLALKENGTFIKFAAGLQHRFSMTFSSSGSGEIELTTPSLGGAQFLLYVIKNQDADSYPSTLMQLCMEETGVNINNCWGSEAFRNLYQTKWGAIFTKIRNFISNGFNQANERFDTGSSVFPGADQHFTTEELTMIKDLLKHATHSGALTESPKVNQPIYDSDLNWVPNLQTIDMLDGDNSGSASIQILNRDNLTAVHLNHVSTVTIKDCDGLTGNTSLTMDNINSLEGNVIIESCPGVTGFTAGNQNSNCHFQFKDMAGLQTVSIGDCLSVTLTDCPALTRLDVPTANNTQQVTVRRANEFKNLNISNAGSHLTTVSLIDTPKFESGFITSGIGATFYLENCSIGISGTATIELQNAYVANQIVRKDNASRSKVYVHCQDGTL